MSDHPPLTLIERARSESGRTHPQKARKKSRKKSKASYRVPEASDNSIIRPAKKSIKEAPKRVERSSKSKTAGQSKRRNSSFIVAPRTLSAPGRTKSQARFDGIPSAPPRSRETMEQAKLRASLRMFASNDSQDKEDSPAASLNLNNDAAPSSIMSMSILGSLPDPVAPSSAPVKEKTIRLIVRRAYRNRVSKQLYCFDEGRRLIIVPTTISYDKLRNECAKAMHKDEVLEALVNEHGQTRAIKDTRFLCNLDELVAVTEGPPERDHWWFCGRFIESLNLGRPDHVPLEELDRASRVASFVQRGSSHLAIVVQKLNSTSPVQEQGSVEIRRMSRGWGKVAGKVLDKNRPFFVYPWGQSLMVDFQIMIWMIGLPLAMGFSMAFIPFNREVLASSIEHHDLYTYFGMSLLGSSTALFINAWIGFYFFIHMSTMSYVLAAMLMPVVAIFLYKWLSRIMFPFYNSPICIMLIITVLVYLMAYPHMPRRLRMKKDLRKDMGNSMIVMDFLILVFVVNRLLVLNFGQRDAMSLFVLSVMYPLLVTRSTTDCARLAEAFNRKTVAVVEAFFTFVSSVFQMIVFLAIDAKVKPFLIFLIINLTDVGCLLLSGPLIAFFQKKNILLLRKHRLGADDDEMSEGFDVFIRWVKDPLKLKPLLVKCYCEASAKFVFITLTLLIRFGSSNGAYPFVSDVRKQMFTEAVYFTAIELCMWTSLQYAVEYYLRWNKCQYMLHKEKKNMLSIATVLGFNNGFITVRDLEAFKIIVKNQSQP